MNALKILFNGENHKAKNNGMQLYNLLFVLFYACTVTHVKSVDFDYLIFSQRWLPTACIEYKEKHLSLSNSHKCTLPDDYDKWSIHGLWPTKNDKFGPFFCNKSLIFDTCMLNPIKSELLVNWPNIEGDKTVTSLWQHEWEKHGTCAIELQTLNSEFKYFSKTLEFFDQYAISALMESNNIVPSMEPHLQVMDIFNIVKNSFGKNPHINCFTEVKTKQALLSEIRLCFDLFLNLIDCEEINNEERKLSKTITNCPLDSKIGLPIGTDFSHRESLNAKLKEIMFYNKLMDTLRVIRFLQWVFL